MFLFSHEQKSKKKIKNYFILFLVYPHFTRFSDSDLVFSNRNDLKRILSKIVKFFLRKECLSV